MKIFRLRSKQEYQDYAQRLGLDYEVHLASVKAIPATDLEAGFEAFSYPAQQTLRLQVSVAEDGVNWRETLVCPVCGLNNRMRAAIHCYDLEMQAYPDDLIYLTEHVTPLYGYFKKHFQNVLGSEFLGSEFSSGFVNNDGVRHEDLRKLSFGDSSLQKIVSLDVFEHVFEYEAIFDECYRVLKAGGRMLWSVPFSPDYDDNLIRASVSASGEIIHHLPAEYHGDPLSSEGVLCYTHFGWQMLDQIRTAGFRDVYVACFYSELYGYLGGNHFFFVASK